MAAIVLPQLAVQRVIDLVGVREVVADMVDEGQVVLAGMHRAHSMLQQRLHCKNGANSLQGIAALRWRGGRGGEGGGAAPAKLAARGLYRCSGPAFRPVNQEPPPQRCRHGGRRLRPRPT